MLEGYDLHSEIGLLRSVANVPSKCVWKDTLGPASWGYLGLDRQRWLRRTQGPRSHVNMRHGRIDVNHEHIVVIHTKLTKGRKRPLSRFNPGWRKRREWIPSLNGFKICDDPTNGHPRRR
jgi:hypothetical protein